VQRPDGSLFFADLKQKLLLPQNEANVAGTRYNVPLINSLVLYVGMQVSYGVHHLLVLYSILKLLTVNKKQTDNFVKEFKIQLINFLPCFIWGVLCLFLILLVKK
jgi:hypothetical protein